MCDDPYIRGVQRASTFTSPVTICKIQGTDNRLILDPFLGSPKFLAFLTRFKIPSFEQIVPYTVSLRLHSCDVFYIRSWLLITIPLLVSPKEVLLLQPRPSSLDFGYFTSYGHQLPPSLTPPIH